jgi:hypothetical protein
VDATPASAISSIRLHRCELFPSLPISMYSLWLWICRPRTCGYLNWLLYVNSDHYMILLLDNSSVLCLIQGLNLDKWITQHV